MICSRVFAGALIALTAMGAAQAQDRPSPESATRLIDGGFFDNVRYAGLAVQLPGSTITYWRNPGDGGMSPRFDFAHSENVESAEPLYPAPERINEDGSELFGYRREVVFPIRVTPHDKDKQAILVLSLDYATCGELCMSVHADRRLVLPAQTEARDPQIGLILTTIPRHLDNAQAIAFAQVRAVATPSGAKQQWLLHVTEGSVRDVFVEGPPDFYIDSAPGGEGGSFLLTLAQHPTGKPLLDKSVRITGSGASPVEFDVNLPQP